MRETRTKVVHSSVSRCGSRIIDEISMYLTHSCVATAKIWTRDAPRFGKPDSERFRDHSFIVHHERFHRMRDRLAFTTFGAESQGMLSQMDRRPKIYYSPALDYSITNLQSLLALLNHSSQFWTSSPQRRHPVDRSTQPDKLGHIVDRTTILCN